MSLVAPAMVLLDSHVSRRYTRTDATIVAERSRHRADGHIASTQFELQAQGVTKSVARQTLAAAIRQPRAFAL